MSDFPGMTFLNSLLFPGLVRKCKALR